MTNPLIAFALVAEEYENSGDPIKGLAPLFRPLLDKQSGQRFDPAAFAREFGNYYGLKMAEFVARALRERMAEIGLLAKVHGPLDQYTVPKVTGGASRSAFDENKVSEILEVFAKWAKRETVRLGRSISREELDEALLSRLARPEFATAFLDAGDKRDSKRIKELLGQGAPDQLRATDALLDYLVASFVLAASEKAPDVFEALSSIAFGSLIADAIAGLAEPGIKDMPDPALRVVIDGPLILDVLDLNDSSHKTYADGLFNIMREAKLRLATFDHIVDEVRESIRSVVKAFQAGNEYGPLGERLRSTKGFSKLAISIADSLEDKMEELGIFILPSGKYERSDFKRYFNDAAFDSMRNAIGEVHTQVERRIRDTKSVATVVRLKKNNRHPSSIFKSGTTFLTRNSALFKKVNHVLSLHKPDPDPRFTIVTDSQLGGVLWFSLGASPDSYLKLSRHRLIANCASAIVPQREVIHRISDLLDQMDPKLKDEFTVLMRDKRASMCPMRVTAGLLDQVDNDSSMRILESMREEIAAPILERAAAEREQALEDQRGLQGALHQRQNVSAELQDVIARNRNSYEIQLAQLKLDLDGQVAGRERMRQALSAKREGYRRTLKTKTEMLKRLRSQFVFKLKVLWTVISVVVIMTTILLGHVKSVPGLILVVLVTISEVGLLAKVLDSLFESVATCFYRRRAKEIDVTRSRISEIDDLIANA